MVVHSRPKITKMEQILKNKNGTKHKRRRRRRRRIGSREESLPVAISSDIYTYICNGIQLSATTPR